MLKREQLRYAEDRIHAIHRQKHDAIVRDCKSWPKHTPMTGAEFAKAVKNGTIKPLKGLKFEVRAGSTTIGAIWDLSKVRLEKLAVIDNKEVERRTKILNDAVRQLEDVLYLGDAAAILAAIEDLATQKF